jgi:alkylation response protein AidB-like acyl-CoA dehydrogenase
MTVDRELPTAEARELIELTRDIADRELAPRASEWEEAETFPREIFALLGKADLMSLPMGGEYGGGAQPYEVYLQVLEEIAARWTSVALGISVHTLSCHPILTFGTDQQRKSLASRITAGDVLGAYCLSEAHAGSDPAAMLAGATVSGDGWVASGSKAWTTHGGHADFYTTFLRTSPDRTKGISCFHVPFDTPGLSAGAPERKMGMTASSTTTMNFDDASLPYDALVGEVGQGMPIALSALDAGRLGVSAVAVGLSQAALDYAVDYACQRETFGVPIIDHQGVAFLLADMDAAIEAARATYLVAARRKDRGQPYSRQASIAKLIATDTAMRVTTDAVQVLGGAGYVRDHPVERYMREAKVMQIFEGTNQIQRMVIGRHLQRSASSAGRA